MAEQIIQRTGLRICAKPGILEIAFDQAATLKRVSDACGDMRDQLLQFARLGSRHGTKHGRRGADGLIRAVEKHHVEVHIQIQRRAETLHQCDYAGRAGGTTETSLAD